VPDALLGFWLPYRVFPPEPVSSSPKRKRLTPPSGLAPLRADTEVSKALHHLPLGVYPGRDWPFLPKENRQTLMRFAYLVDSLNT
jgi:hypothetical protein